VSTRAISGISAILLVLLLALPPVVDTPVGAVPLAEDRTARLALQNVDWMSPDQAARLALSFPVMVPTWIPGPFGGAPSVQAGGGYYSLYWMNAGGAPTFLQISGEVGGGMPVGSPADLNVRLSVNASVQGYDAIHDVTSIYDNVWWVAGGVLYTVSSNNMTGTDSLSLANSLVALQPPAVEPTATTAPPPPPTPTSAPVMPPPPPTPTTAPAMPPTATTAPAALPTVAAPQSQTSGPRGEISNAASVPSANVATLQTYPSAPSTLRATHGTFSASGAAFISGITGGSISWQAPSVDRDTLVEFTLVDEATGTLTAWSSMVVTATSSPTGTTGTSNADEPTAGGTEESVSPSASMEEVSTVDDTGVLDTSPEPSDAEEPGSPEVSTESTVAGTDDAGSLESAAAGEEGADQAPLLTGTTTGSVGSDGTAGPPMPRSGDGTAGPDLPRGDGTGGIRQIAVP
jgi:hypothetical protein